MRNRDHEFALDTLRIGLMALRAYEAARSLSLRSSLSPAQARFLDRAPKAVQEAVRACKRNRSRYLPERYWRATAAQPPRDASSGEREQRLQRIYPELERARADRNKVEEELKGGSASQADLDEAIKAEQC